MADALRASDEKIQQTIQESLQTWSSYLDGQNGNDPLPRHAIDLSPLVAHTPPFLGGLTELDENISFSCEGIPTGYGKGAIFVNGRSTWRTSQGTCDLHPLILPAELLLAGRRRLYVTLSKDCPLSVWPGVQGLSRYDTGNHMAVLYVAWAYILSARWVELLGRSADHDCKMRYPTPNIDTTQDASSSMPQSDSKVEIEIGNDACEDEVAWWHSILCSDDGFNATTEWNGEVYLSPWSVSAKEAGFSLITDVPLSSPSASNPPDSTTALKYLSRFCVYHNIYAQCSVALVAVLDRWSFREGKISLPFPKKDDRPQHEDTSDSDVSIPNLLTEHSELLPRYMTLSLNPRGFQSLMFSTFFNADIECNLASAWLNSAFAVVGPIPITRREVSVATLLANRQPRTGIIWLAAILTDTANINLRHIRNGMTAVDLLTSGWTGIALTFMTSKTESNHGEFILREDECRLLYMTSAELHDRIPVWPYKPFGSTKLEDTELEVQQHVECTSHCLEYESWEWILTNGGSIQCSEVKDIERFGKATAACTNGTLAKLEDYQYDLFDESSSQGFTAGIFMWLRCTGYSFNEKPIYTHSWLDHGESTDGSEPTDSDAELEAHQEMKRTPVEEWLQGIE